MKSDETLDGLFEGWRQRIEKLIQEHPLQIISWEATRRCNLLCRHCGTPSEEPGLGRELSTEEVIGAFDQIACDFDMTQFRHINITGGEPFVRKDLLNILQSIARWPFYRNTDIQTNGVFISDNPHVLKDLRIVGVTGLGISIDGFEATHDALRGIPGSWNKATNAARLAVEAGYTVTVSFVAHAQNLHDLTPFHDFVKDEIRPRVFRVMFIDPQGRALQNAEYLLSADQTRRVVDFLKEAYTRSCVTYSDPSATMVELGCGGWLGKELEGKVRPFIFHCIAGINNLGILFDGKLGSCSNIARDYIQGDLRCDRIKSIWDTRFGEHRTRGWKYVDSCRDCTEQQFCNGGPMHLRGRSKTIGECLHHVCVPGGY